MASKVGIISNAFILLGKAPVNDLTTSDPIVTSAVKIYDMTYPDLLAAHPWRFAMEIKTLDPLTAAPVIDEWTTAYLLPGDLIQLYRVYQKSWYRIYQNQIYANTSSTETITIEYTHPVTEDRFPAYFTQLFTYKMAALMAMPVTELVQKGEYYEKMATGQLAVARSLDSQQNPNVTIQNDIYLSRHYGD
jgi:hypothetical protein